MIPTGYQTATEDSLIALCCSHSLSTGRLFAVESGRCALDVLPQELALQVALQGCLDLQEHLRQGTQARAHRDGVVSCLGVSKNVGGLPNY